MKRLSLVEARLFFLGQLRRSDVAKRFSGASIQTSRDLAMYKELAPDNLVHDFHAKTYRPRRTFRLIFSLTLERVLYWLKSGLADGLRHPQGLSTEVVGSLSLPKLTELAAVTRAIHGKQILEVTYVSLSSATTDRQIVPHALVDNGQCWHVRAYDRTNAHFSDFLIARMAKPDVLSLDVGQRQLCLVSSEVLDGVDSAVLAPGYVASLKGRD